MSAVVRKIAVTFEKRDWGAGRETWRERTSRRRLGNSRYAIRRLSTKQSIRREKSGAIVLY